MLAKRNIWDSVGIRQVTLAQGYLLHRCLCSCSVRR